MHQAFSLSHLSVAFAILFAGYVAIRYDTAAKARYRKQREEDNEVAELIYRLQDVLEQYRKLMDRSCCWHQKQCPTKGDARILPEVVHAVEVLSKRALPEGITLSSEDALRALQTELALYAKNKADDVDLEALLPVETGEDGEPVPKPRGRPRKQQV